MGWQNQGGWQQRGWGMSASGGGGGATATWNPSDKYSGITLSNGNLTATTDDLTTYENVRATSGHSTGKFYYEASYNASESSMAIGIGNSSADLAFWVGSSTTGINAVGWSGSSLLINGAAVGTVDLIAQSTVLSFAVDLSAKLMWVRLGAGNWNANASADPAAGAIGIDISSLAVGTYFPMATVSGTGGAITANFGGTAYTQSVPSGYGNW